MSAGLRVNLSSQEKELLHEILWTSRERLNREPIDLFQTFEAMGCVCASCLPHSQDLLKYESGVRAYQRKV